MLEDVKSFLQDQYGARGKYAARIDTNVEEVAGNRVKIKIDIVEGKRAKIRQINIVGNKTYKEKDILEAFELKTPNLLSFYKQDDRYSRESLQGDLEKLRSFYMDRGYANFEVESTQVAIAPGEGRHLHHGERQRRRGLQGQGSEAGRHLRDRRKRCCVATCWCSRATSSRAR